MFTHPKPVVPAHLRRANRAVTAFDRGLTAAIKGRVVADQVTELAEMLTQALTHKLTPAEQAEQARYEREVAEYNKAVDAHNEIIRKARQTRINTREVAAIRRAACTSCFTIHAGECA